MSSGACGAQPTLEGNARNLRGRVFLVLGMSLLVSAGYECRAGVADGDGARGVLCYRAFGVAPGGERREGPGDGPDADAALAAGDQLGRDGGLGLGQGGGGVGS